MYINARSTTKPKTIARILAEAQKLSLPDRVGRLADVVYNAGGLREADLGGLILLLAEARKAAAAARDAETAETAETAMVDLGRALSGGFAAGETED